MSAVQATIASTAIAVHLRLPYFLLDLATIHVIHYRATTSARIFRKKRITIANNGKPGEILMKGFGRDRQLISLII
jgi:hypothetical protein